VTAFIEWLALHHSARTATEYRLALARYVAATGVASVAGVTLAQAQGYARTRREAGVAWKSIHNELQAVRSWIRWGIETNQIIDDPLAGLRLPKPKTRSPAETMRPCTQDDLDKLVALTRADEAKGDSRRRPRSAFFLFIGWTGLRWSEACGMNAVRWEDIDLDAGTLTVRGSRSKGKRDDTVPLLPIVVDELRKLRELWPDAKPTARIFPKIHHETLNDDLERAGIPKVDARGQPFSFHSFRHGFGRRLALASVPVHLAQRLMRHRDPRMTLGVYAQHTDLEVRDALGRVGPPGKPDAPPVPVGVPVGRLPQKIPTVAGLKPDLSTFGQKQASILDGRADQGRLIAQAPTAGLLASSLSKLMAATGLEPVTPNLSREEANGLIQVLLGVLVELTSNRSEERS
jgi:integrase